MYCVHSDSADSAVDAAQTAVVETLQHIAALEAASTILQLNYALELRHQRSEVAASTIELASVKLGPVLSTTRTHHLLYWRG